MKMRKIALAISTLALAPSAFALDLTTGVPAGNIFYIGGASAQTPGLAVALGKFCNATTGNLKTYFDIQDGKQAFVYTCDAATAASGLTVGSKFVVAKVDAGGSWSGLDPVVNRTDASKLRFPTLTDAVVGTPTFANSAVTAGTAAGDIMWDDGTSVAGHTEAGVKMIPDFALSDVSLNLFKARGKAIGSSSNYSVKGTFGGQGFGVIVSPSLYAALQTDQGISTSCAATDGSCQPSISKAQYANIAAGTKGLLQQLLPATTLSSTKTLLISRRSTSSGTQAASDQYFLNFPCNATTASTLGGAGAPVSATFTDTPGGVGTVVTVQLESSTGNVKSNVKGAAGFAIGVVSLENAESGFSPAKYVKINGVSPTYYKGVADTTQKKAIVNGLYDFAYESHMVVSSQAVAANANVDLLASALRADLANGSNLTTSPGLFGDPTAVGKATYGTTGNSAASMHTSQFSRGQNECKTGVYKY